MGCDAKRGVDLLPVLSSMEAPWIHMSRFGGARHESFEMFVGRQKRFVDGSEPDA